MRVAPPSPAWHAWAPDACGPPAGGGWGSGVGAEGGERAGGGVLPLAGRQCGEAAEVEDEVPCPRGAVVGSTPSAIR